MSIDIKTGGKAMISEAQREASVKFYNEIKPIEDIHDEVVTSVKSLHNSILFRVHDTVEDKRLNSDLRKRIDVVEKLHAAELRLVTSTLRNHYL